MLDTLLQEFNKGLFDYLIATDDVHSASHDREAELEDGHPLGSRPEASAAAGPSGGQTTAANSTAPKKRGKRKGRPEKDEEFGVTRCARVMRIKALPVRYQSNPDMLNEMCTCSWSPV